MPEGLSTVMQSSPYDKNNELRDFRCSLCLHITRSSSDSIISADVRLRTEERGTLFRFPTGVIGFSALQGAQTGPGTREDPYGVSAGSSSAG